MKKIIAISMGDYNGIGPEVILKTLRTYKSDSVAPLLLGNLSVFKHYSASNDPEIVPVQTPEKAEPGKVSVIETTPGNISTEPGSISKKAGKASMEAVERGIKYCLEGSASALVTAPISKEAIRLAGYNVPGHTEFLAEKTDTDEVMMILANDDLRVGLATIHVPLRDVAGMINQRMIVEHIQMLNNSLRNDFGIQNPKIAVLGLNPHAGDGGVIGREEIDIIEPAVNRSREEGINAEGPFAADGFFGSSMHKNVDAVLAMYHDQGLIPFKSLTFGTGVNFTAGLPIIRTSPDHGTAFSIAGTNQADHGSFESAFLLAVQMAEIRETQ